MKIIVASDHTGVELKSVIVKHFMGKGYPVLDMGPYDVQPCSFADYAAKVAREIIKIKRGMGVLIASHATGINIIANKHRGIRSVAPHNEYVVQRSRELFNTNVLCLDSKLHWNDLAIRLVSTFIKTKYIRSDEHNDGINRIMRVEKI